MHNVKFIGSFRFKLVVTLMSLILIPLLIFYFSFFNIVKGEISEKYSGSALQSIRETAKNIDFIFNNIVDFSNVLMVDSDFTNLLKNSRNINPNEFENTVRGLFASREDVENIYVYSQGNSFSIGSHKVFKGTGETQLLSQLTDTEGEVKWINSRHQVIKIMSGEFDKYYFSLGRKIIDLTNLEELGVLIMDIDEGLLERNYKNLMNEGDIQVFIVDSKGSIVSHPEKSKIGFNISNEAYSQKILFNKNDYGIITYQQDSTEKIAIYSTCHVTGWKLVQVVPSSYLFRKLNQLMYAGIVISLVYLVFAVMIALILSLMLTRPIINLMRKMKEAENGNFDVQIAVRKADEIGQLGITFNKMISEIKSLVERIREEEKIKKEIELEVLHAQINPHFLYNTLNSIKWMAKMQRATNISSMVTALIKLLRVSINLGKEKIKLEEEITYVQNYVHIQKVRFNEQFEVLYSIDERCKESYVPKLILQPIVENSIIYGSNDDITECLRIEIKAFIEDSLLILEVVDNGPGIDKEVLGKIFRTEKNVNKFSAVGLNNVNERIKLYFGEEYGISIHTELGKGTCIRISMPYVLERKGEENV